MAATPIAESAAKTVMGTRRASNQDRYVVDQTHGIVLLADGVAGRPAGGHAAAAAIDAAYTGLCRGVMSTGHNQGSVSALLVNAFRFANSAVFQAGTRDARLFNMATSLVGAVLIGDCAVIANVGDCRIYLLRQRSLRQVTYDHVRFRHEMALLSEEDAKALQPLVHLLTRAVGHQDDVEPDIYVELLRPDDLLLFCSNGLSDVLEAHRITEVLLGSTSLADACERLVQAAAAVGAMDDVTVIVARPGLSPAAGALQ